MRESLGPRTFYAPHGCDAHKAQRIMDKHVFQKSLHGDVHAVQIVCRHPPHYSRMLRDIHFIVREHLHVEYNLRPDPRWSAHMEALLSHTLYRTRDHVRGRLDLSMTSLKPAADDETLQARGDKLKAFLNGDPKSRDLVHYFTGAVRIWMRLDET